MLLRCCVANNTPNINFLCNTSREGAGREGQKERINLPNV